MRHIQPGTLFVAGDEEEDVPVVSVAVLAEALVVRCANLGASVPAPARRRTAFCPPTVDTFAWPMDLYDLTSRSAGPLSPPIAAVTCVGAKFEGFRVTCA